jgi:hypothetical protein
MRRLVEEVLVDGMKKMKQSMIALAAQNLRQQQQRTRVWRQQQQQHM